MNVLLFAGSLRKDSLNKKLLNIAYKITSANKDLIAEVVDIKALQLPVYDGDIETAGMPDGVLILGKRVSWANAIIIASPEYNASISSPLKNTVDWLSRLRPIPLESKPVFLMGASPGGFGAIRWMTTGRSCFETLGNYVYPQTFALPNAHEAFTEGGEMIDKKRESRLEHLIHQFIKYAEKLNEQR